MSAPIDTRLPREFTRLFGVEELHSIHFQHRGDRGGPCDAVSVVVPEASRQVVRRALSIARKTGARVSITCDTADQAPRMHEVAVRARPNHRLVAMERAAAGAWGLS